MRFRDDEMVSGKLVNECDKIIDTLRSEIDTLTDALNIAKGNHLDAMGKLSAMTVNLEEIKNIFKSNMEQRLPYIETSWQDAWSYEQCRKVLEVLEG